MCKFHCSPPTSLLDHRCSSSDPLDIACKACCTESTVQQRWNQQYLAQQRQAVEAMAGTTQRSPAAALQIWVQG